MPGPIGLLYRFVKRQFDEQARRAEAEAGAGPPDGAADVPSNEEDKPPLPEKGGQEDSAAPPAALVADAKAAAAPMALRDPRNRRSKRQSYLAMLLVGFALAIDFTTTLMSIQPLYYVVGGAERLYGLTFGSYDLSSLIFSPLFGLWSDCARAFKAPVQLGSLVNAAGNFVYGFTVLVGQWWMMLIGRLVAGAGGATLGIGSSYIAQTSSLEQRQVKLGNYRIVQNIARTVGPFVGYLFLGLPQVNEASSTGLKIFNWYTVPGWVAGCVVLLLLVPFFHFCFVDPTEENEHRLKHEAEEQAEAAGAGDTAPSPERRTKFNSFAYSYMALAFLFTFSLMSAYSNLFALFAGQYHQVTDQYQQWKTFVAVGAGAVAGGLTYRHFIRLFPQHYNERILTLAMSWVMFVSWLMAIPYKGQEWVPPPALYYTFTALMGITSVVGFTAMETTYSKKVTQYADVVGRNVGWWLGLYFMSTSAGRFAGPLVIGAATFIATPAGDTNYCVYPNGSPGWAADSAGDYSCAAADAYPQLQCAVTGDEYYIMGCVLLHSQIVYPVYAGLQLLVTLAFHVLLYRHWNYENPELQAKV